MNNYLINHQNIQHLKIKKNIITIDNNFILKIRKIFLKLILHKKKNY